MFVAESVRDSDDVAVPVDVDVFVVVADTDVVAVLEVVTDGETDRVAL